jgi:hypothetical protein
MANGNFLNYMWPFGSMTSNAPVEEQTTQDQTIKSPTSGYEMLDVTGRAQANKLKKDAAMQTLYEENPDQLGTIEPTGEVNKMSMLPEGVLDYVKNLWGRNEGIASPNIVPENMRQYLAGTDWRSQMQPASAFGTTGAAPMTDRIMDPDLMEQAQYRSMLEREPVNVLSMREEGEPYFAEGWRPGDILDRDTTMGGYQKFPEGDQWRNKDKYLRSEDYLSTLEPSLAGLNQDRKGFQFPGFLGVGLGAIRDKLRRPAAKQEAYDAIMGSRDKEGWGTYKGNQYNIQDGKVYSEVNPFGSNFDSMFGSQSLEEQDEKRLQWAMDRVAKGKGISTQLRNVLKKRGLYQPPGADKVPLGPAITGGQRYEGPPTYDFDPGQARREGRRPDKPGGFTDPGKDSYGPWSAQGGYMGRSTRSRYSNGGRVGILAAF